MSVRLEAVSASLETAREMTRSHSNTIRTQWRAARRARASSSKGKAEKKDHGARINSQLDSTAFSEGQKSPRIRF